MHSQDNERRRIARNLHDSLGQHLASIKMNLNSLKSDAISQDVLNATLKSVEECLSETRTLSSLLHPPLLDEVGFSSAARWYTEEFAKRSGIKVELELPDEGIERLPELVRIALFRILQESLTNIHRHSGSASVEVRLKVNHQAVLTVRDFGRGVPAELLQGSHTIGQHFGVGLSGMRERVNDLGGTFEIQSSGNGTLIAVSIPLVETSAARNNSGRNRIA
jgi:signal transduction histidine kinase